MCIRDRLGGLLDLFASKRDGVKFVLLVGGRFALFGLRRIALRNAGVAHQLILMLEVVAANVAEQHRRIVNKADDLTLNLDVYKRQFQHRASAA